MPLADLVRRLSLPLLDAEEPEGTQYGAIPYRIVEDKVVFLMITSRRSANWIFPKGSAIKDKSAAETAAHEAFEEAGVTGEIEDDPIGVYLHERNNAAAALVEVQLFALRVTEQLEDWPEAPQRFRHWALLPEVRRLMASKQAARVAVDLNRRILFGGDDQGSERISV